SLSGVVAWQTHQAAGDPAVAPLCASLDGETRRAATVTVPRRLPPRLAGDFLRRGRGARRRGRARAFRWFRPNYAAHHRAWEHQDLWGNRRFMRPDYRLSPRPSPD